MESIREHFRAIIFHKIRRGLSRQECIDELAMKHQPIALRKNWFNGFNCGRHLLKFEVREVPPKTAVVPEKINAVQELIMVMWSCDIP